MDCLSRLCCCGSASSRPEETTELVQRVRKTRPDIIFPQAHLTGVSPSFEQKIQACHTTPVPWLGTHGQPFPIAKSVHIIQDTDTTLKIITLQYKPSGETTASINLHHVLFPNYNFKGDPGERWAGFVSISEIKVNGIDMPDIPKQKVYVHDGRFSPELEPLVSDIGDEPVTVSATITVPTAIYKNTSHLYAGIGQIKMLNIMCPAEAISFVDSSYTLDQVNNMIDGQISSQIQHFINGSESY